MGVGQDPEMKPLSNFVSLHPYFKVHPRKLEMFKAGFPALVEPPSPAKAGLRHAQPSREATAWQAGRREESLRDPFHNKQPARRLYPS